MIEVRLTLILDHHDANDHLGHLGIQFQFSGEVIHEFLFVVVDNTVRENDVASIGERRLMEFLGQGIDTAIHQ